MNENFDWKNIKIVLGTESKESPKFFLKATKKAKEGVLSISASVRVGPFESESSREAFKTLCDDNYDFSDVSAEEMLKTDERGYRWAATDPTVFLEKLNDGENL